MPAEATTSVLEPCVDQTSVAKLPDFGDHSHDNEGESVHIEIPQICSTLKEKDAKSVKMLLRSLGLGVMREERKHFWKGIYHRREGDQVDANKAIYEDTVKTCFGKMEFPDSCPPLPGLVETVHTNTYCLTEKGRISVARILTCFAYNQPDIQYCPILYPLAAVLRHYVTEDETYGFLTSLVASRQPKFMSTSRIQHEVDWRTVLELNQEYNKRILIQIQADTTASASLDDLFQDWIWWIFDCLPLPHIIRILDCFFIEGFKVLIRTSLALIRHFSKQMRINQKWARDIKQNGLKKTFRQFCKEMPVAPNVILDRAFKFRGLSRANIQKISLKVEIDLKAKGFTAKNTPTRSKSSDNLPSPKAVQAIQAVSETLTYKQGMSTPQPRHRVMAVEFPIHDLKSLILKINGLITIWHWLPERMTTINPTLAYSSEEHGISLTTFYAKTEKYEPSILVIKTMEGEIFGAYCSTSWGERNLKDDKGLRQSYFGTGETFLFKIGNADGEGSVKYPWVGLDPEAADTSGLTKAELHARELFMSGQHDMFSIGGGGGCGIYIDSTLTHGKTEKCATFNNEPLCKNGDFQVAVIETYGLNCLDW